MARNPFDPSPQAEDSPQGWQPLDGWRKPAPEGVSPENHIREIPTATWQEPRRKDTRKRPPTRTLLLLPRVKERLEKWAQRLGVPRYELTRYLLEYSLTALEYGRLSLEPQLSLDGLSLYPQEQKRRKRRKPRTEKISERGIPAETWQRIVAQARVVPVWQVVNYLLEHGLAALESGQLRPQPQHRRVFSLY